MESSSKRRTRVIKARLCHRMDALSIFVNGDQCDHREEEDAYSPKNSKVTEVFIATEMVCGV
jgi:hypothetical protein